MTDSNPFLQQEDYYKALNDNVENMKNDPRLLEFEKMCFELFEGNELGRRFMEYIHDRYMLPSLVERGATYQLDLMWADGFKDFIRMLIHNIQSAKQRIAAGS